MSDTFRTRVAAQRAQRPQGPAFASFLERDANREARSKSRRNTVVISLVVHGLAVAALVVWSLWNVDQLWGPSVNVKVYSKAKAPKAAVELVSRPSLPDPLH
jgi:hypothetical protein